MIQLLQSRQKQWPFYILNIYSIYLSYTVFLVLHGAGWSFIKSSVRVARDFWQFAWFEGLYLRYWFSSFTLYSFYYFFLFTVSWIYMENLAQAKFFTQKIRNLSFRRVVQQPVDCQRCQSRTFRNKLYVKLLICSSNLNY